MELLIKFSVFALTVAAFALRGVRGAIFAVTWSPREFQGLRYEFGQLFYKGKASTGFVLRFAAPRDIRLMIRRETAFDKLGKALRVAVEPQLGDADFDARFYLDCEDQALIALLQTRLGLRNLLRQLQIAMRARDATLRTLRLENGKLDVQIDSKTVAAESGREAEALEWLKPLVEAFRTLPPSVQPVRDRARLPQYICIATWLIGVIGCTALSQFWSDRLIDPVAFVRGSFVLSAIVFVAFLLAVAAWLGPVPRRHRVLAQCLLLGLPGFLLSGILLARAVNLELDSAAIERVGVKDASLYTNAGGNYRLSFTTDDQRLRRLYSLHLSGAEYDRLQPAWRSEKEKHPAVLLLHPGAFGFAWVEPE